MAHGAPAHREQLRGVRVGWGMLVYVCVPTLLALWHGRHKRTLARNAAQITQQRQIKFCSVG
jgi:hypothetical protein